MQKSVEAVCRAVNESLSHPSCLLSAVPWAELPSLLSTQGPSRLHAPLSSLFYIIKKKLSSVCGCVV